MQSFLIIFFKWLELIQQSNQRMQSQFKVATLHKLLLKACQSTRSLQSITVQEISQACENYKSLQKLNDRALLILMLAKSIFEKFAKFPKQLDVFLQEMFPVEKKQRVRRARQEDEEPRRRRKTTKTDKRNDLTFAQEATSMMNNNQIQVNVVQRNNEQQDKSNNSSNPTSNSNADNVTITNQDIKQAQRNMQGEITLDNPEHDDFSNPTSQDSSKGSVKLGEIHNYTKIIQVLGTNIFSNERKTRKKRGDDPTSARPTKKKAYFNKADEKIQLQSTNVSFTRNNISLNLTMEQRAQRERKLIDENKFRQFDDQIQNIQINMGKISFESDQLVGFQKMKLRRKGQTKVQRPMQMDNDFEMADPTDMMTSMTFQNYESTAYQPPDTVYMQELNDNIFISRKETTFTELQATTKKDKSQLFLNLLWLQNSNKISLNQEKPEQFGEIFITRNLGEDIVV